MSKNPQIDDSAVRVEANFDHAMLTSLLGIGDDAMRIALCEQLLSDFRRMAAGLDGAEPVAAAKIAHELQGLAATIGAQRLADLARTLNHAAERVSHSTLAVLKSPVIQEIEGVLTVLNGRAMAASQQ